MALLKEFVLSLNKRSTRLDFLLSNYPQVLQYFMTNPLDMIFWRFWYTITRLLNLVKLSIYSKRALFHKYFVAMK